MRERWCAMLQTCGIGAGVGRGWLAGCSCGGLSGGGGAWRGAVAGRAAAKLVGGPVFLELHFHVAVRAAVFVRLGRGFEGRGAGCRASRAREGHATFAAKNVCRLERIISEMLALLLASSRSYPCNSLIMNVVEARGIEPLS